MKIIRTGLICVLLGIMFASPVHAHEVKPSQSSGYSVQTDAEFRAQMQIRLKAVEAQKALANTESLIHKLPIKGTEKDVPKADRFVVAQAKEGGAFAALDSKATLQQALEAVRSREEADLVVIDVERVIGNGVIYMTSGFAIASPAKVSKEGILTYGEGAYLSYVSHGYDAKYLGGDGVKAAIELMGMKGNVVAAENSVPVDQIELIPSVHMKANSYYENRGGTLTHVLQTYAYSGEKNAWEAKPYRIAMGEAPEFMYEGTPYYSYDAYTFYEDSDLESAAGTYEPYFKLLPIRSKTAYTAEELNLYIASWKIPDSAMKGIGGKLKQLEETYGINAAVLLSIATHESARGTSEIAKAKNNLFGIDAIDKNPFGNAKDFVSIDANLEYMAKYKLNDQYLNPRDWRFHGAHLGDNRSGLNVKYASDPYWGEKVTGHLYALDSFLGGKDLSRYALGRTNGSVAAYETKERVGDALYTFDNPGGNFPSSMPVILTGEGEGYYSVQSFVSIRDGVADPDAPYSRNAQVFVSKAGITRLDASPIAVPKRTAEYVRLAGQSRYETAVEISKARQKQAKTVLLANGNSQIDALSAAPLAHSMGAQLLLTGGKRLEFIVEKEIERLEAVRIVIIGGTNSVPVDVEVLLADKYEVERIQGANRYETSAIIARRLLTDPRSTHAFLANGISAVDALSVGPIAAKAGSPILLTDGKNLDPSVLEVLIEKEEVTIIGGAQSVSGELEAMLRSTAKVDRIAGANRYQTSTALANRYTNEAKEIVLSTGSVLADGLAGASFTADANAPLLLVGDSVHSELYEFLSSRSIERLYALGGQNSVSDRILEEINRILE